MGTGERCRPGIHPAALLRLPLFLLEGQWDEAEGLATVTASDARGITSTGWWRSSISPRSPGCGATAGSAWRAVRQGLPAGSATEPGTAIFS